MKKVSPVAKRSEEKVSFEYYSTLEDAEIAAACARADALRSGWKFPGAIKKMVDGTFEVCCL